MSENIIHEADEMLSANQAGKLLGVSGKTVIRLMEKGAFPGYEIGNAWKFERGDIERYKQSRRFQANSEEPAA